MSDPSEFAQRIDTERLTLRRPRATDADAIYRRYASDAEVTRYMGWPRHRDVEDTHAFLNFSDDEWARWPAGPYLILLQESGAVLGCTGLTFKTTQEAEAGYVLARDAWGMGYATEALSAMLDLAPALGIARLHAHCHPDHRPSQRVLEKADFVLGNPPTVPMMFPNLDPAVPLTALAYSKRL